MGAQQLGIAMVTQTMLGDQTAKNNLNSAAE